MDLESKPSVAILLQRLILPTIIIIAAFLYFLEVQGLKNSDNRLLINPVFWIMLVLYPLIIWHEIKTWKRINSNIKQNEDNTYDPETTRPLSKKLSFYMIGIAIYLSLINYLGFVIMTLLFLPTLMFFFGTKSIKILTITPIVVILIIYFIFINLLSLPFPVWPQL